MQENYPKRDTSNSKMKDLNYFPLNVESNIYSMTTLELADKTCKVLVATQDCQIYCIEYVKFKPHTREVEFTYIPNGAKIISIEALKRGPDDFVIGITHSLAPNVQKNSARASNSIFAPREVGNDFGRLTTYYLNIYASGSSSTNFDLDHIAQGCQTIRLRYVPYHLYNAEYITIMGDRVKRRPFWLLSGGDNNIHAFCEEKPYQSFTELSIEDYFPELTKTQGLVLWIDMLNLVDDASCRCERLVALGFEDGSVKLYQSLLSSVTNRYGLVRESCFNDFSTITPSVRLFKISSVTQRKVEDPVEDPVTEQINLLAISSTNPSIVFRDVLSNGLNKKYELPDSQRLDCSVTSAIGDIDFDGRNEILIGTHGRELLYYQYHSETNSFHLNQFSELNHPIFSISILNLTADSLRELVVMLVNGILILQANVDEAIAECKRRVERLLEQFN